MADKTLPPSPNWYLSSASDANEAGVYVYAARMNVYVFDISVPKSGPRMLRWYPGHTERVASVSLSPSAVPASVAQQTEERVEESEGAGIKKADVTEGVLCCSGGDDKMVKIWAVDSMADVQSHSEHKEKVTVVSWSAVNSNLVASGDEKGEVIMWNRKTNTVSKWRQEKDYIYCMAFCPHEPALLAVGVRQGTVFLVDFSSGNGRLIHRLRGHDDEVLSLSWCPVPGETFLKDSENGTNTLTDPDRNKEGCLIATGSKDRTIRVWSRTQGRQLFMKKLPAQRREFGEQGPSRNKGWVAVHWLKFNPEQLASSSSGGELLLWNLKYAKGQQHQVFDCSEFRAHYRPIFNICATGPKGETLCTYAQERNVLLWSAETTEAVSSLPTLGGHVYCVRNSPIDPGRVAVGVGDAMIRVWNTSSKTNPYDVTTLRQGIKSKVTALAWHPSKEGLLGFGTEDGRVGVYDVLSNKMPSMSSTFHHRTVYVVNWGPHSANPEESKNYSLYSVGDCKILEHTSAMLSRSEHKAEAVNITEKLMTQMSGLKATELSWNLDVKAAAVGADDGSVYIISALGLKLLATVKVHNKLMNCTRWHPAATDESPSGSPCSHWLASGGNDQVLHVVDLSCLFVSKEGETESVVITNSLREFRGHVQRVTDISWSPHHDGRMVSVGYDDEAFVWDVKKGVALAQFKGHWGRVLTCQFSGLDPDLVLTGGSDSTLMMWRVSQQPLPELGERKKKKRKPAHTAQASSSTPPQVVGAEGESDSNINDTINDAATQSLQQLQDLLEQKRQSLAAEQNGVKVAENRQESSGKSGRCIVAYDDIVGEESESVNSGAVGVKEDGKPRKQDSLRDGNQMQPANITLSFKSKTADDASPVEGASDSDGEGEGVVRGDSSG
ncbi:gem-associated protein 5-like, partial [Littorina saxatilis]|uniref:gem-associated protein 5-like n=1 Tax=Littorina saxatilis TaxID=31220 RepID=UPI0038B693FE